MWKAGKVPLTDSGMRRATVSSVKSVDSSILCTCLPVDAPEPDSESEPETLHPHPPFEAYRLGWRTSD